MLKNALAALIAALLCSLPTLTHASFLTQNAGLWKKQDGSVTLSFHDEFPQPVGVRGRYDIYDAAGNMSSSGWYRLAFTGIGHTFNLATDTDGGQTWIYQAIWEPKASDRMVIEGQGLYWLQP